MGKELTRLSATPPLRDNTVAFGYVESIYARSERATEEEVGRFRNPSCTARPGYYLVFKGVGAGPRGVEISKPEPCSHLFSQHSPVGHRIRVSGLGRTRQGAVTGERAFVIVRLLSADFQNIVRNRNQSIRVDWVAQLASH